MGLIKEYKEFMAFRKAVKETGRLERVRQRREDTEKTSKALAEIIVNYPKEVCWFAGGFIIATLLGGRR